MNLKVLEYTYQVIKLKPISEIPQEISNNEFYSITRTEEEISIVTTDNINIQSDAIEKDWKIIKIVGVLDFSLIGILSKISNVLANNDISIFVVSTYNTDYIMIKNQHLEKAIQVLKENNYKFN